MNFNYPDKEKESLKNTTNINYGTGQILKDDAISKISILQKDQNELTCLSKQKELELYETGMQVNSIPDTEDSDLADLIGNETEEADISASLPPSKKIQFTRMINRHNSFQDAITSCLTRNPLLPITTVPLEEPQAINSIKAIDAIFDSFRLHFKWLWPAIFAGLSLHDIGYYLSQPENHYGNNSRNLFLGLSRN